MRVDVGFGTCSKGHALGRGNRYRRARVARLDRVDALGDQLARFQRLLARLSKRIKVGGAKPHVSASTVHLEPVEPHAGFSRRYSQVEPSTVSVETGPLRLNLPRRQPGRFLWQMS